MEIIPLFGLYIAKDGRVLKLFGKEHIEHAPLEPLNKLLVERHSHNAVAILIQRR